ncbi:MAG: sodium:solute symporter family protein, partial [Novibacillus thermophilus]
VGWLPTIVASFEWKRMNSKAALASMITGVASFIVVGELVSAGWVTLPEHIDELMIALMFSVIALVVTAMLTKPNQYELNYFQQMKNTSMSQITIKEVLSKPDGLMELKKQYRLIVMYAVVFTVISAAIWGYFFIKLGL